MILQQLWKDIENEKLKIDETEGRSYGIITRILKKKQSPISMAYKEHD